MSVEKVHCGACGRELGEWKHSVRFNLEYSICSCCGWATSRDETHQVYQLVLFDQDESILGSNTHRQKDG